MKRCNFVLKKILSILMLSIIITPFLSTKSFAAPKSDGVGSKVYTKSEVINDDIVFKGVFTSHSVYFNIDQWWSVDNVEVEINLSINQLVDITKDSYVTFNINGVPFYSYKIVYNPKQEVQSIKVKIPKDNLKEGVNEFKIDGYCRITDKSCVDDVNNANWLVIKKQSKIDISYKEKISNNDIMNFPYPFIKANSEDTKITQIVIPDAYTDSDLEKALLLSAYLGKESKSSVYKGELIKYSDLKKENNENNIIFIGNKNSISQEINNVFKDIKDRDLSESAIIRLGNSPYKNNPENSKIMLISSDNDKYLLKAVNFLINRDLTTQVSSDTFLIDNSVKDEMKVTDLENKITFESLGINEMQFKGPFRRTGTVSYFIPKNRIVGNGAKIKLNFRYSENLDFDRSLLTVYINNTPIGSKKLEKENALGDELELQIPIDAIKSNYIEIKIAFDLELTNSYCETRQEEMPWALVTGDSYIYSETKNSSGYFFNRYPSPFVMDGKFNDVLLSVPDNLEKNELVALGQMLAMIGREITNNTGNFEVSRYSKLNGREKNKNLIVYGTPDSNNLIKDLNENLWFKYINDYKEFSGNEKLYLTQPFSSNISIFQLDVSPYNSQKAILTLTSSNRDILAKSLLYLKDPSEASKLTGDSVIVDQYGDLREFKFKTDEDKPVYEKVKTLDSSAKGIFVIIVLIVIFLVTSIIMYFMKNKKSQK